MDDQMIDEKIQPAPEAPTSIKVARALFYLMAVIWGIFGVASLLRGINTTMLVAAVIVAILMFANAALYLWAGWGIGRQRVRFYNLGIALLAVNLLLTITDQMGIYDWITLVIDLAALILLFVIRLQTLKPRLH
jgi:hypothetical protein